MSLDLSRLENVRQRGEKTLARCPACAERGHDEKGEHLVIMPDGRFGCVAFPGAAGKDHRRRVSALAGDPATCKRGACLVRVIRPPSVRLPRPAGRVLDLSQLGTGGTPFCELRVGVNEPTSGGGEAGIMSADTQGNSESASHPSQPFPASMDDEPKCLKNDVLVPGPARAFTRQMLGDCVPALSKRLRMVQAAMESLWRGWNREDGELARCLENVDHPTMALAAVHAGMVLVGALHAGQDAKHAGETATAAFCDFLGIGADLIRVKDSSNGRHQESHPSAPFVGVPTGKASHLSHTIPPHTREAPTPDCNDQLMATESDLFGDRRQAASTAQAIDPETGYPIIAGAICPF